MSKKLLVVDDEVSICELIKYSLESEGFIVYTSNSGYDALEKISAIDPDLIILDVMLPEVNGLEICRRVSTEKTTPVILVTAKTDTIDKVLGLELGADDYITKPFETRELVARVKALLRRSLNQKSTINTHIKNGKLEIFLDKKQVFLDGNKLDLSHKEFDLLTFLASNVNQTFSREELMEKVWGYDFVGDTHTVDVHIQRLRKKFSNVYSSNELIQTVFGVGYKMIKQE